MAGVAVGAILSVASTLYSQSESKRAAREAKSEAEAMGRLNEMNARAETGEALRIQKREQEGVESMAQAKAAASGVKMDTGSTNMFLKDMGEEHQRQTDWTKRSGLSQVNTIRAGVQSQKNVISAQQKASSNTAWASLAGNLAGSAAGSWANYSSGSPQTTGLLTDSQR